MTLFKAFVQELTQLNRGNADLHCTIVDEPGQTVVLEFANSGPLRLSFEWGRLVEIDKEGSDNVYKWKPYRAEGVSDEEAVSKIIANMRSIDPSFDRHVEAVNNKSANNNRGPRGLDTI